MRTSPRQILFFAIAFSFFILAPPFLGQPFPLYSLIHWADVLDLLTPLVLIPLYWGIFRRSGSDVPERRMMIAFLSLAALWVLGQGMHLSANSIGNLLGAGSTDVHRLVHFYDEDLSHLLWHGGIIGLAGLILVRAKDLSGDGQASSWGTLLAAALLYGFTYFAAINEGGTVLLGLPSAILICAGVWIRHRRNLNSSPLTAFFFYAHLIAIVFFAGWFLYWGGFPEFSETGLL